MKKFIRPSWTWSSVGVVLTLLAGSDLRGDVAFNYSGAGAGNMTLPLANVGSVFTVSPGNSILVTQLGAFDNTADGQVFRGDVSVAIYTALSPSTRVVDPITFTSSDFGTLDTGTKSYFKPVAGGGVTLGPGSYFIAASNYGNDPSREQNYVGGGLTFNNSSGAVSYNYNQYNTDVVSSWGPTAPSTWNLDFGSVGTPTWTGGNFIFTPVPEPEHYAMAGLGLLGLVYVGRNLWLRRRAAA